MKIIFSVLGVALYFNCVSPVASYYLYDDNPKSGYVAKVNSVAYTKYGSLHKRRFHGDGHPKFMKGPTDHAVDAHFRVLKSPPSTYNHPKQSWNSNDQQIKRNTEATVTSQEKQAKTKKIEEGPTWTKTEVKTTVNTESKEQDIRDIKQDPLNKVVRRENYVKKKVSHEEKPIQKENAFMKLNADHKDRYEMYKTLEVNVNKKSAPSEYQKNLNINNHQLSINAGQHYRRVQSSAAKGMYKAEKYTDRNIPLLHKVLDNMSYRMAEHKPKKYDYRKRETKDNVHQGPHNNKIPIEKTKQYSKDGAKDQLKSFDKGGESADDNGETNDVPYAVFYRMNPVALNDRDEVILDTMDDDSDSYNEKRPNGEDEVIVSSGSPHLGNIKFHRKIMNFFNYKKL